MIIITFLYVIVLCIGIGIMYYGYEKESRVIILLGGVISTIGVVGGTSEMINDIVASTPPSVYTERWM